MANSIDRSSDSKINYDFYPENIFMPRRKREDEPLTNQEKDFLNIYSLFAGSMQTLVNYQKTGFKPDSGAVVNEKIVLVCNAERAAQFLTFNPFSNKEATNKLVRFLVNTGEAIDKTITEDIVIFRAGRVSFGG